MILNVLMETGGLPPNSGTYIFVGSLVLLAIVIKRLTGRIASGK